MLRRFGRWVKEFWIELAAVLLVLLGIVVIVGGYDIQDILLNALSQGKSVFDQALLGIINYYTSYSFSHLASSAAVIGGAAFVIWRVRFRFSTSDRFDSNAGCPRCGSSLHRTHRSRLDRMLSATLLPHAHRYRCSNAKCGWSGLLRPRHESDRRSRPASRDEAPESIDTGEPN